MYTVRGKETEKRQIDREREIVVRDLCLSMGFLSTSTFYNYSALINGSFKKLRTYDYILL